MILLALETGTEACSVALWIDGDVRERFEVAPRRHAELVLPWTDALLAEAGVRKSQLDAIACGRGPGAFTGVRLAVALTQGLALALDRPVLGISTLAALALDAPAQDGEPILAAIDARMGEVYAASFRREGAALVPLDAERVLHPEAVQLPAGASGTWQGVGSGFAAAEGLLARQFAARMTAVDASALPRAAHLARLAAAAFAAGQALAPERVEPAYLRDNVALTLAEQQLQRAAKQAS